MKKGITICWGLIQFTIYIMYQNNFCDRHKPRPHRKFQHEVAQAVLNYHFLEM